MTTLDALRAISDLLSSQQIAEPQAKANVIVEHVLGNLDVLADVSDKSWRTMLAMAARAQSGEPVEYITGKAYFRYLELDVNDSVLIPRKETEQVAGAAIDMIRANGYTSALDMCTGSGCIAISLATETDASVHAADISEAALDTAKGNAQANDAVVDFFISDMFNSVTGTYDIIVCNPPYISEIDYDALCTSVKDFEPALALVCGDGLAHYQTIAKYAGKYINSGGALVLEIGADQGQSVQGLLRQNGFRDIECKKDYQGRDRIITAYK